MLINGGEFQFPVEHIESLEVICRILTRRKKLNQLKFTSFSYICQRMKDTKLMVAPKLKRQMNTGNHSLWKEKRRNRGLQLKPVKIKYFKLYQTDCHRLHVD